MDKRCSAVPGEATRLIRKKAGSGIGDGGQIGTVRDLAGGDYIREPGRLRGPKRWNITSEDSGMVILAA